MDNYTSTPNRTVSEFKVHDRRYVGTKETVAYLLNDFSKLLDLII